MVLVIKPQSEHLSPRVGSESWHEEPSSRNEVSTRRPLGQPQLSVYLKLPQNTDSSDDSFGYGLWLLSCGRAEYLQQELYTPYRAKSIYYVALYRKKFVTPPSSPRPALGLEQPVAKIPAIYKLEIEKKNISIQQCQLVAEFSIQHFLQFKNMGKTTVLLTVPDNI